MEIKSEQGKLLRYCWGYDGGFGICVVVFEVVSVCYFLENGDTEGLEFCLQRVCCCRWNLMMFGDDV